MKEDLRQSLEAQWQKDADLVLFVANANTSFPELRAQGKYFWKTDREELSAEIVDAVLNNQLKDVRASYSQAEEEGPWTETVTVDTLKQGSDIICSALQLQGFRLQDITKELRKVKVIVTDDKSGQDTLAIVDQVYDAYVFERLSTSKPRSVSGNESGFWASTGDSSASRDNRLNISAPKIHRGQGMNRGSKVS